MYASCITLNPGARLIRRGNPELLERGRVGELATLGIGVHVELDLAHAEIELLR
jgi:hypothetical protein